MVLFLIGLGLNDEKDLSLKAIEAISSCDSVFCELYTNDWQGDLKNIEKVTGHHITVLSRQKVESDFIVNEAKKKKICLLIPGDPLTATTHIELFFESKKSEIDVSVIHSSSIYTSIAETGLQTYKFGRPTTLVSPSAGFHPRSPYDIIVNNHKLGLHSLVLLDIDKKFDASTAAYNMIEMESDYMEGVLGPQCPAIAVCRLGNTEQIIRYGTLSSISKDKSLSMKTPAVIIIPGNLNFKEEEVLDLYKRKVEVT